MHKENEEVPGLLPPPSTTCSSPVWPPADEPVMRMVNDAFGVKGTFQNECDNRKAHAEKELARRRRREKLAKKARRRNRR